MATERTVWRFQLFNNTDKRQTGKFNYHGQNEEKGFPGGPS